VTAAIVVAIVLIGYALVKGFGSTTVHCQYQQTRQ
jgi:hypothetical protein